MFIILNIVNCICDEKATWDNMNANVIVVEN